MSHAFSLTDQTPLLLLAVLAGTLAVGRARRVEGGHLLALMIFAVYLVGVANFTLLPLRYDPELARQVGAIDLARLVNLRPWFLGGFFMPVDQALLNMLLTVPFGFGLPFVVRLRGAAVLVAGVLFSVGIELAQLMADALYLALPTWSVDINDVILNSLGVLIGYAAFLLAAVAYRSVTWHVGDLGRGPWSHFHDTLRNGGQPRLSSGATS